MGVHCVPGTTLSSSTGSVAAFRNLDEAGAVITPTLQVRKEQQGWVKVLSAENPVSWAELRPPTFACGSPNPHPVLQSAATFGDRVFEQVHRVK